MENIHNEDDKYLAWYDKHPDGFVLNHFGGKNPAFNVLHRSRCTFLWRDVDEGVRTTVPKWCSSSEQELEQHADSVLGSSAWKRCGFCLRLAPDAETVAPSPPITKYGAPLKTTHRFWSQENPRPG